MQLCWSLWALAPAAWAQDLDHRPWQEILIRHITAESRVDYKALKASDVKAYVDTLAGTWPQGMTPQARYAASINAYNALTIQWILSNYPVKSIWKTKKPFTARRHMVDGKQVSLDDIENGLRQQGDPRVHAVLVCAARSCPPLRREAYTAEKLEQQMDDNARAWLANGTLNRFLPDKRTAEVSSIFDWFAADFANTGVAGFLARYGPEGKAGFLREPGAKIKHLDYHWGLNDAGPLGADYSKLSFYFDALRNK